MKKILLLSLLFIGTSFSILKAQSPTYYHEGNKDTITNASYSATPDSSWTEFINTSTSPLPQKVKFQLQAWVMGDSISGGFGDSARCNVQIRILPRKSTTAVDTNKYNSIIVASGTLGAGNQGVYWNSTPLEISAADKIWILVWSFPGVISTRIRMGVQYFPY